MASTHGQKFEGLLDSHINYHIDRWVKPTHDADQHDHLKIQCVLEARSLTIDDLVARSQCSLPQVKKTLIGLFVAGALGEFKHEVRQFEKSYDNQQAEQISLMV